MKSDSEVAIIIQKVSALLPQLNKLIEKIEEFLEAQDDEDAVEKASKVFQICQALIFTLGSVKAESLHSFLAKEIQLLNEIESTVKDMVANPKNLLTDKNKIKILERALEDLNRKVSHKIQGS